MKTESREEIIARLKKAQEEKWDADRGLLIVYLEEDPCEDCVSRSEMEKTIENYSGEGLAGLICKLMHLPSVCPITPSAHWTVIDPKWGGGVACGHCGRCFDEMEPFCGSCGRRMFYPVKKEDKT